MGIEWRKGRNFFLSYQEMGVKVDSGDAVKTLLESENILVLGYENEGTTKKDPHFVMKSCNLLLLKASMVSFKHILGSKDVLSKNVLFQNPGEKFFSLNN